MANICENTLEVRGTKNEFKKFYEKGFVMENGIKEWSLGPYYPLPDGEDGDWYSENWGTYGDCCSRWETTEFLFRVRFETCWTPPIEWLQKVQEDYQSLHFFLCYIETGCGFCGMAHTCWSDGEAWINDCPLEHFSYSK
jgi:Ferredoxin-like domain in Api92-like protein